MPCRRLLLLLALTAQLTARAAQADCELQYAPPQLRARLLAFHYANEQRRAQQHAQQAAADAAPERTGQRAQPQRHPRAPAPDR